MKKYDLKSIEQQTAGAIAKLQEAGEALASLASTSYRAGLEFKKEFSGEDIDDLRWLADVHGVAMTSHETLKAIRGSLEAVRGE